MFYVDSMRLKGVELVHVFAFLLVYFVRLGENLSDQELSEMMAEADIDQDNRICFEEFVKMMAM